MSESVDSTVAAMQERLTNLAYCEHLLGGDESTQPALLQCYRDAAAGITEQLDHLRTALREGQA